MSLLRLPASLVGQQSGEDGTRIFFEDLDELCKFQSPIPNPLFFLSPISFRLAAGSDPSIEHVVRMSGSEETAEDEVGAEYRSG